MDPSTERRSRYIPREQALPNSSRRIARSSQRSHKDSHERTSQGDDRRKDADEKTSRATQDLIDHLKARNTASNRRESSNRSSRREQPERGKKEKRSNEVRDSVQGSRGRQSGSKRDKKRQDEAHMEDHDSCDVEIDGGDELSDGDYNHGTTNDADLVDDGLESDPEMTEEMDNNHPTARYYDENGKVISDMHGLSDAVLVHLKEGCQDSKGNEYLHIGPADFDSNYEPSVMTDMISVASVNKRSNSPELNPNTRMENDRGVIVSRAISSDPPTSNGEEASLHVRMEPNEEVGSVYQRELEVDAPPSPKGPELRSRKNHDHLERNNDRDARRTCSSRNYTNYVLDDVGREQYNQLVPIHNEISKIKIQQDPPESNRGLDVPAPLGPRVRSSRSKRDPTRTKKEDKKKPELKSILKKKNSPPVVSYFGKPVQINDDASFGSEPSVTEVKQDKKIGDLDAAGDKSIVSKSGLRSGKYANTNDAVRRDSYDSDNGSEDSSLSCEDDSDGERESGTLTTISGYHDGRFDRSKTYYLRTSDLGLTQDTIFPEQFLDNPKSKAEPHYHHPSPHPPPGIQFHVDENYLAINDGKGGYSPVAPQAVDALVSIGYRTAIDPVMWTPSSKTRKYMNERGLRFGDIPIPGPMSTGEGGPDDSTCMVWSGKFSHKYYGHDLLAIRSQGVINMSAEELVDLLMDSDRIHEYNQGSNGRTDEITLSDGSNLDSCPFSGRRKKKLTGVVMDNTRIVDGVAIIDSQSEDKSSDGTDNDDENRSYSSTQSRKRESSFVGVTKVVRSINVIPLVKKKMDSVTLVHCRALSDEQGGNGYIIVGRNVYPADDTEKVGKGVTRSEVLLNVHIIRKFKPQKKGITSNKSVSGSRGQAASARELSNRCFMTNVSHLKNPMIPSIIAKKMGCSAAANFINDIRALARDY